MSNSKQNRKIIGMIGDLVEALYGEVSSLPISDAAKNAMVTIMISQVIKRDGANVFLRVRIPMLEQEAVAAS